jgi:hypothetical protein
MRHFTDFLYSKDMAFWPIVRLPIFWAELSNTRWARVRRLVQVFIHSFAPMLWGQVAKQVKSSLREHQRPVKEQWLV